MSNCHVTSKTEMTQVFLFSCFLVDRKQVKITIIILSPNILMSINWLDISSGVPSPGVPTRKLVTRLTPIITFKYSSVAEYGEI